MTTINYPHRIRDFVDQLSTTGHVTHTKFRKKSVTFHHNGGVGLSHEEILQIWRSRPASAHFDVDVHGDVAQFVEVHEYAWAVGNTVGNEETISIEMANDSGRPHYEVSEATWRSAATLAGWLFAHIIRERPTRNNVFPHQHWSSTDCPGPYVLSIFDQIVRAVQDAYEHFNTNRPPTPTPHESIVVPIQRALEVAPDDRWGTDTDRRATLMRVAALAHAGYPHLVRAVFDVRMVQAVIDTTRDAVWGPRSQAALVTWIKGFQRILGVTADGHWGPETEAKFQQVRQQHLIR